MVAKSVPTFQKVLFGHFQGRLLPLWSLHACVWGVQVWYFWSYAAASFLIPFLNLYFHRLGFSKEQIGLLTALRPWLSAISGASALPYVSPDLAEPGRLLIVLWDATALAYTATERHSVQCDADLGLPAPPKSLCFSALPCDRQPYLLVCCMRTCCCRAAQYLNSILSPTRCCKPAPRLCNTSQVNACRLQRRSVSPASANHLGCDVSPERQAQGALQRALSGHCAGAGSVFAVLADQCSAHKLVLLATYTATALLRFSLSLVHSFGLMLVLVVVMEVCNSPINIIVDAAVMGAAGVRLSCPFACLLYGLAGWC